MKILNSGTPVDREWWVGMFIRCPDCGLEATLESGDDVQLLDKRALGYGLIGQIAQVRCPNCNAVLSLSHREIPQELPIHQ